MKEMLLINKLIAALRTRKEKTFRDEKLLAEIKNNEFENTHLFRFGMSWNSY